MTPGARYQRRKAAAFVAQGLTTGGSPRRRRIRFATPAARAAAERARSVKRWRVTTARHLAIGLTVRGTMPRRIYRISRQDAYVLKLEFETLARQLNRCFDQLTGPARAAVLQLAHALAAVRARITVI